MKRVLSTLLSLMLTGLFALTATAAPPRPYIPTVVIPVGNGNYVVNTGRGLPTLVQIAQPTCIGYGAGRGTSGSNFGTHPPRYEPFNLKPAPGFPRETSYGGGGGYFPNVGPGPQIITNPYVSQQ